MGTVPPSSQHPSNPESVRNWIGQSGCAAKGGFLELGQDNNGDGRDALAGWE